MWICNEIIHWIDIYWPSNIAGESTRLRPHKNKTRLFTIYWRKRQVNCKIAPLTVLTQCNHGHGDCRAGGKGRTGDKEQNKGDPFWTQSMKRWVEWNLKAGICYTFQEHKTTQCVLYNRLPYIQPTLYMLLITVTKKAIFHSCTRVAVWISDIRPHSLKQMYY